ncbi:MAG TPA: hypothetical protein VHM66_05490, partial [Solirubrobacterales bacterium]|nr:hypothetical protein [Solirubrobacterales bacterium]
AWDAERKEGFASSATRGERLSAPDLVDVACAAPGASAQAATRVANDDRHARCMRKQPTTII